MIEYSEIELKLRRECEDGFSVGAPTNCYLSVTAETYTEICGGNVRDEAEAVKYFPTIEAAYEVQLDAFKEYVKGRSGSIYWRVYPELGQNREKDGWVFYMRLLISDKPVLKKSAA